MKNKGLQVNWFALHLRMTCISSTFKCLHIVYKGVYTSVYILFVKDSFIGIVK